MKIDLAAIPEKTGSAYPAPYDEPCVARSWRSIGEAAGLTSLGVNLARIPPGSWSSQRHWHSHEDECVWVVEGEVVLVTNSGEETLRAGECAAFRAGDADGHHLINRGERDVVLLQISSRDKENDRCDYPDLDMIAEPGEPFYRRREGTRYSPR